MGLRIFGPEVNHMSYQSITGVPTETPLTSQDTATLKAYVTSLSGSGQKFSGLSSTQIAQSLNSPETIPNPTPQGVTVLGGIPRQTVLTALAAIIFSLNMATPINTQLRQAFLDMQTAVQGNQTDPILLTQLTPYVSAAITAGAMTQAQFNSLTQIPDPNWSPTVTVSPWGLTGLSVPMYIEAGDITTALAS